MSAYLTDPLLVDAPSTPHVVESPSSWQPSHVRRPLIPVLTGLRGVLCVWVMLHNAVGIRYYASRPGQYPSEVLADWLLTSGSVAVTMFFCLSGFVLFYAYADHAFSTLPCYGRFVLRRYARLMPLYWISQLMALGLMIVPIQQSGYDGWQVLHWIALALGMDTWFPWPDGRSESGEGAAMPPMLNPALWSIQTELFFYCCFPLLCRLLRRMLEVDRAIELLAGSAADTDRRLKTLCGLFAVFSCTSLLPFLAMWKAPDTFGYLPYAMPLFRISDFILGMLTAALYFVLLQRQHQAAGAEQSAASAPSITASVPSSGSGSGRVALASSVTSPLWSRWTLDVCTLGLGLVMVLIGLADVQRQFLAQNPGSFSAPLCLLLLLMVRTESPLAPKQPLGFTAWILTRPLVVQLGVLSFAFYTFHLSADAYALPLGFGLTPIPVLFCTSVGLAVMGHYLVEKPVYAAVTRRLDECCSVAAGGASKIIQLTAV